MVPVGYNQKRVLSDGVQQLLFHYLGVLRSKLHPRPRAHCICDETTPLARTILIEISRLGKSSRILLLH